MKSARARNTEAERLQLLCAIGILSEKPRMRIALGLVSLSLSLFLHRSRQRNSRCHVRSWLTPSASREREDWSSSPVKRNEKNKTLRFGYGTFQLYCAYIVSYRLGWNFLLDFTFEMDRTRFRLSAVLRLCRPFLVDRVYKPTSRRAT